MERGRGLAPPGRLCSGGGHDGARWGASALREVAGLRGTPELEAEHAEAMELARTWYNKHYFNYGQQVGLYNPQQVLHFLANYESLRKFVKNLAAATAESMDLLDHNQAGLSERSQRRLVMQSNALAKSLLPLARGRIGACSLSA